MAVRPVSSLPVESVPAGATVVGVKAGAVVRFDAAAFVASGVPDGSVTTAKIVDGAVTAAKVAADVATQAELDAHTHTTAQITSAGGGVISGTSYTVVAGDKELIKETSSTSAVTVSLPSPSSLGWSVGDAVVFVAGNTGMITFAAGSGSPTVNGTPSLTTKARWSVVAAVVRPGGTGWVVTGSLA